MPQCQMIQTKKNMTREIIFVPYSLAKWVQLLIVSSLLPSFVTLIYLLKCRAINNISFFATTPINQIKMNYHHLSLNGQTIRWQFPLGWSTMSEYPISLVHKWKMFGSKNFIITIHFAIEQKLSISLHPTQLTLLPSKACGLAWYHRQMYWKGSLTSGQFFRMTSLSFLIYIAADVLVTSFWITLFTRLQWFIWATSLTHVVSL